MHITKDNIEKVLIILKTIDTSYITIEWALSLKIYNIRYNHKTKSIHSIILKDYSIGNTNINEENLKGLLVSSFSNSYLRYCKTLKDEN